MVTLNIALPKIVTGEISFPSGFVLTRSTSEKEFLRSPEGRTTSQSFVSNPPNESYRLTQPYELGGERVRLIVWFSSGRLKAVSIYIDDPNAEWSNWSEAEELRKEARLARILDQ